MNGNRYGGFHRSLLIPMLIFSISSCAYYTPTVAKCEHVILGQTLSLKLHARGADTIARYLCGRLTELEAKLSMAGDDSHVARINSMSGIGAVCVHDDLYFLVERSLDLARVSEGVYNPAAAPLYKLWDEYRFSGRSPSRDEVNCALEKVDYRNVRLYPETKEVFLKNRGMALDLGEIVDGFIVDFCAEILMERDFLGTVLQYGNVSRYISRIGEENIEQYAYPRLVTPDQQLILTLKNCENRALAIIYPQESLILHLLNGYPVKTDLLCVAVIGPDGVTADALAHVFVAGDIAMGMQLVEDMPFFEALCVTQNREIFLSRGGREYTASHAPDFRMMNGE